MRGTFFQGPRGANSSNAGSGSFRNSRGSSSSRGGRSSGT